jgi:hypothetical protein
MTYLEDVVYQLPEIKFVKWIISKFSKLTSAYNQYKECRVRADTKCKHVIAADKFVGSSLLYWLLLPLVLLATLPVLIILLITGFIGLVFRTLVHIGITVQCMWSAVKLTIYALIVYLIGSGVWWLFSCEIPVTLTLLYNAIVAVCWAGIVAASNYIAFLAWYIDFIIPCNLPAINTSVLIIGIIIGFGLLVGGAIIYCETPYRSDGELVGGIIVMIGILIIITAFMFVMITGAGNGITTSETTFRYDGVNVTDTYCDVSSECYVKLSNGAEMCIEDDYGRGTLNALMSRDNFGVILNGQATCYVNDHGRYPKFMTMV